MDEISTIRSLAALERDARKILLDRTTPLRQRRTSILNLGATLSVDRFSFLYNNQLWFVGDEPFLSAETFHGLRGIAASCHRGTQFTEREHVVAQAYVSELLEVDLSGTEFVSIPALEWDGEAEASSFPCDVGQHVILAPSQVVDAASQMAHEYGHAAHWTLRRTTGSLASWIPHHRTAEFVSYACQLQFILENGDRREMAHALEALSRVYFGWLVASTTEASDDQFTADPRVLAAFNVPAENLVAARRSLPAPVVGELYFRMYAFGMAVQLVAEGKLAGLRNFAIGDRVDADIEALAAQCFGPSHHVFRLGDLEQSIAMLLNK